MLFARAQFCDFRLAGGAHPRAVASSLHRLFIALGALLVIAFGALLGDARDRFLGYAPELHVAIHARGRDPRAGMREGYEMDPPLVTSERGNLFTAGNVPEPHDVI